MHELVLFKDIYDENPEPEYGILMDRDEPGVICLGCGSTIEFGDYEIIEKLPWENLSDILKGRQTNKYVVCMNSEWVRDSQMMNTNDLTDAEFNGIDFMSSENDDRWHDMEPNPFIAIIEAESEEEACQKAAEQKRYDKRCLYAIKI